MKTPRKKTVGRFAVRSLSISKGSKAIDKPLAAVKALVESSSWLSWYRGTLVSLTDCRWWFDPRWFASKPQDRRPAEKQRARTKL